MFEAELQALLDKGLYRRIKTVESAHGSRIKIDGREMISLASNDYLGLAAHPVLKEAAWSAVEHFGAGSGASRLLSGTSRLHHKLEAAVANFLHCESALVLNSGYAANTGVLPALCGEDDLILSDALNHASIVDGCRLSKANKEIYKHLDNNMLEDILKVSSHYKKRWIVTESLFSMDGDLASLTELVDLAERYDAQIYLDEAHAVGVFGKNGRGCASHFGVEKKITLRMGTFGKALGSFGAFVAGDQKMIELIINRARSFIYSTALPPAVLGASRAALDLVQRRIGVRMRAKLFENVGWLAEKFAEMGVHKEAHQTQIIPVILGSAEKAVKVSEALYEAGIFAPAIRPPTVPEGTSRIRFSIMATHHPKEDLERVFSVLKSSLE